MEVKVNFYKVTDMILKWQNGFPASLLVIGQLPPLQTFLKKGRKTAV